jgi:hypothetical protein
MEAEARDSGEQLREMAEKVRLRKHITSPTECTRSPSETQRRMRRPCIHFVCIRYSNFWSD